MVIDKKIDQAYNGLPSKKYWISASAGTTECWTIVRRREKKAQGEPNGESKLRNVE